MPMLPNTNMARGSSWGGFGYNVPRQQVPGRPQGMGAYANAGNMPPPAQLQGMGQRTLTPEMAAQYRPQMMANALMGTPGSSGAPPGSYTPEEAARQGLPPDWVGTADHPRDLSMYNNTGNSIPNLSAQQMGMAASPGMGLGNAQAPQLGGQFGIAQPNMAQPAQAQPAMQRPMPAPRGYAR